MKRLFLDANILFTACHNPDGKAAFIISLAAEGAWKLFTSAFALEEARRNLAVKFPALEIRLDEWLGVITVVPERLDAPFPEMLADKDRPIFQAAYSCGATHLLTGDLVHFGRYMMKFAETHGVKIMTPSQFLVSLK
jgi:predicted nucleic acid-binding protein